MTIGTKMILLRELRLNGVTHAEGEQVTVHSTRYLHELVCVTFSNGDTTYTTRDIVAEVIEA